MIIRNKERIIGEFEKLLSHAESFRDKIDRMNMDCLPNEVQYSLADLIRSDLDILKTDLKKTLRCCNDNQESQVIA
jgi:phage terminase Nu1 subunit (DNA packaging protein)